MANTMDKIGSALHRLSGATTALTFAANHIERFADVAKEQIGPGIRDMGTGAMRLADTAEQVAPRLADAADRAVEHLGRAVTVMERMTPVVEAAATRLADLETEDDGDP